MTLGCSLGWTRVYRTVTVDYRTTLVATSHQWRDGCISVRSSMRYRCNHFVFKPLIAVMDAARLFLARIVRSPLMYSLSYAVIAIAFKAPVRSTTTLASQELR